MDTNVILGITAFSGWACFAICLIRSAHIKDSLDHLMHIMPLMSTLLEAYNKFIDESGKELEAINYIDKHYPDLLHQIAEYEQSSQENRPNK